MTKFDHTVLDLDCQKETERIAARMAQAVGRDMHRRGVVVALSGGIDSSVCTALSAQALTGKRVLALLLPERESSRASIELGLLLAKQCGVEHTVQDITATLEAIGCYRMRDEAIRAVFPDYGEGWKNKIVIGGALEGRYNVFRLVVQAPDGTQKERRIPLREYLQIVAAQNYKQRIRKTIEYFHADRLNYAVIGTPNRLEYDQGFFVKNGDGSADIKPIAHLYKTQVYALARHLGIPEEICRARPTTDTYSLQQGQDEFYFALPYEQMDLCLWAHNHQVPANAVSALLGIEEEQALFIYQDIETKRRTTGHLHHRALLMEPVNEIRPHGGH